MTNFPLGADDILLSVIAIIGLVIIRFWLIKIYRRVRQIAKIMEKFYSVYLEER